MVIAIGNEKPVGRFVGQHLAGKPQRGGAGSIAAEARRRGARMMDVLAADALTVTLAVSLGQIRTLIEHPSSMTHAPIPVEQQVEAGIEPGGIRLSIGLEHPDDLVADLGHALAAVGES